MFKTRPKFAMAVAWACALNALIFSSTACQPLDGEDPSLNGSPSASPSPGASPTPYPANFVRTDKVVISGLEFPTSLRFMPDGKILVAEKKGLIKLFQSFADTHPTIVVDIRDAVFDFWDRGLLSIELDPAYPARPYLYALYTYDAPISGTAPVYRDVDNRSSKEATPVGGASARLSRFTLGEGATTGSLIATSERVLIHDWCQVFPSHSVGTVRFGADGALYVSAGDAASFERADWGQLDNFCGDPVNEGGSIRSQRHANKADGAATLDGSIIRINPDTGAALNDNPQTGNPSQDPASENRVIAYGLRNPFRFNFRPGTNELWIGDVGWNTWEEVNRLADPHQVTNFGWPCFEGNDHNPDFASVPYCQTLYAAQQTNPGTVTLPYYSYLHGEAVSADNPCGGGGASVSGIAFYTAGNFPSRYNGAMFIADYARNCIWVQLPGADGLPDVRRQEQFLPEAKSPVELQIGPGGDIFYPSIIDGQIHQVTYQEPEVASSIQPMHSGPAPVIETPATDTTAASGSNMSFHGWGTDLHGELLANDKLHWEITVHHCAENSPGDCHNHTISVLDGVDVGSFVMPTDHSAPSYVTVTLKVAYDQDGANHTNETVRTFRYAP